MSSPVKQIRMPPPKKYKTAPMPSKGKIRKSVDFSGVKMRRLY
jgi:hypothetical protein